MEGEPKFSEAETALLDEIERVMVTNPGAVSGDEEVSWRTPSASSGSHGACFEFGSNGKEFVGFRDSKDPYGGVLRGDIAVRGLVTFAKSPEETR